MFEHYSDEALKVMAETQHLVLLYQADNMTPELLALGLFQTPCSARDYLRKHSTLTPKKFIARTKFGELSQTKYVGWKDVPFDETVKEVIKSASERGKERSLVTTLDLLFELVRNNSELASQLTTGDSSRLVSNIEKELSRSPGKEKNRKKKGASHERLVKLLTNLARVTPNWKENMASLMNAAKVSPQEIEARL